MACKSGTKTEISGQKEWGVRWEEEKSLALLKSASVVWSEAHPAQMFPAQWFGGCQEAVMAALTQDKLLQSTGRVPQVYVVAVWVCVTKSCFQLTEGEGEKSWLLLVIH